MRMMMAYHFLVLYLFCAASKVDAVLDEVQTNLDACSESIAKSSGCAGTEAGRKKRFVTFHTGDQGNIEVELEFAVPFVEIPVKRSLDTLANVNLGAIALSGVVFVVSVFVIPAIVRLISNKIGDASMDNLGGRHRTYDYRNRWTTRRPAPV